MSGQFVPVIDYMTADDEAAEELYKALTSVGYALFTGTGICHKVREYSEEAGKFFHYSAEEKEKYVFTPANKSYGGWFTGESFRLNKDRPADLREGFHIRLKSKDYYQSKPEVVLGEHCWRLWDSFTELAQRINYLIALGLKLDDPHLFSKTHNFSDAEKNLSAMRINWYPQVNLGKTEKGQMRIGEHTDFGTLTLLYAGSPGIQVLNTSTMAYEDTVYTEDGIFVNVGDLLQRWSGDKILATKHRVLMPYEEKNCHERTSVVFACFPDKDVVLETLDGSCKYAAVTAEEQLEMNIKLHALND